MGDCNRAAADDRLMAGGSWPGGAPHGTTRAMPAVRREPRPAGPAIAPCGRCAGGAGGARPTRRAGRPRGWAHRGRRGTAGTRPGARREAGTSTTTSSSEPAPASRTTPPGCRGSAGPAATATSRAARPGGARAPTSGAPERIVEQGRDRPHPVVLGRRQEAGHPVLDGLAERSGRRGHGRGLDECRLQPLDRALGLVEPAARPPAGPGSRRGSAARREAPTSAGRGCGAPDCRTASARASRAGSHRPTAARPGAAPAPLSWPGARTASRGRG